MNSEILSKKIQQFINDNLSSNIHKILLRKSPFSNVTSKELVEQIESKAKSKQKLPTWFSTENIYYPNKLNLSQTSSEITAYYKASLIHGNTIADITAGLGIDSFAFSLKMKHVVHVEKNEQLSQIAKHNFKQLGIPNIKFVNENGLLYLNQSLEPFDWIYIDPSRRDKDNKKVYYLSDCEPNIINHLDSLFAKSKNLLIKTGPLLDLNSGLKQLKSVKEIHIVAVANEVKELLWILEKDYNVEPVVKTVNFKDKGNQSFQFKPSDELSAISLYSLPQKYLYEPNAAILKSGVFQYLGKYYNLHKLHTNSHLYTSNILIPFPGRIFKILDVHEYSKKSIKKLELKKANITTRNFPDSVAKIRKKLNLKDGGNTYLFCTTDFTQNLILINCTQIFKN